MEYAIMSSQQLWRCDVCKTAQFVEYIEACRHEEACKRLFHPRGKSSTIKERDTKACSPTIQGFFDAPKDKITRISQTNLCVLGEAKGKSIMMASEKTAKATDAAVKRMTSKGKLRSVPVAEVTRQTEIAPIFAARTAPTRAKAITPTGIVTTLSTSKLSNTDAKKRKGLKSGVVQSVVVIGGDREDENTGLTLQKEKKHAKTQSTLGNFTDLTNSDSSQEGISVNKKRKSGTSSLPLASIFDARPRSEILAEQRAVELAAKRRLAVEQERIRQQRSAHSMQTIKRIASVRDAYQPKQHMSERFPKSSHVGATIASESSSGNFTSARIALCNTPMHPNGKRTVGTSQSTDLRARPFDPPLDSVFQMLSCLLAPRSVIDFEDNRLWVEKFSIQNVEKDLCGSTNKAIAQSCIDFIDSWKIERRKARDFRAQKQQKLAYGKRNKISKKHVDNDLWGDSDDEASLPSICLLTGPVGCGKTNLVHAVTRYCDCKLIEINTTKKRGSQELRNAIEEATQSDSTFDFLKNNSTSEAFFGKSGNQEDSDSEDKVDVRRTALSVIFFDEVDLLFDENGDSGFWVAVKSLSKKAKCPIFLTANVIPPQLISCSMCFKHYEMIRPEPTECVTRLLEILRSEDIQKRDVDSGIFEKTLLHFVELCNCDLRRMINEVMLFSKVKKPYGKMLNITPMLANEITATVFPALSSLDSTFPEIESISPEVVKSDDHTLLQIKGRNFMSLANSLSVYIGGKKCVKAKVVSETTILAVCPPLTLPSNDYNLATSVISKKQRRSLIFPLVTLESNSPVAHFLNSGTLMHQELYDNKKVTAISHLTIEYALPTPSLRYDESSEAELHVPGTIEKHADEASKARCTRNEARVIIDDTKKGTKLKESAAGQNYECLSFSVEDSELSTLADNAQIRSDVAWIEQSMGGLPYLAGASLGFGMIFSGRSSAPSGGQKLCRNDNAKPPKMERLLLNSWNDEGYFFGDSDAYMTNPPSRERYLLAFSNQSGRGASTSPPNQCTPSGVDCSDERDVDDINCNFFPRVPEEDAFVSRDSALSTLPAMMSGMLDSSAMVEDYEMHLLSFRMRRFADQTNSFFSTLWEESNAIQVFARKISREICSSPSNGQNDDRIFLDYSPMVTKICAFEKCAIAASSIESAQSCESLPGRRQTRRSRASVRAHYLGSLNLQLYEEDLREMGKSKAEGLLQF